MSQPQWQQPQVVPVVVTQTVQSNKHHGGLWWFFIGWWWWGLIGWWWKPIKGVAFSGPRALIRKQQNASARSQAQADIQAAMNAPRPAQAPPPGWYADPDDPAYVRWYDGSNWSDQRQLANTTPPRPS